jgi:hypothetical protein
MCGPLLKPFLTNKGSTNQNDIILQEQNIIETDQQIICETFNNCFVNVAKNSGDSNTKVDETHPSIIEINNKYEYESLSKLDFQPITEDFVSNRISKINVKKATGIDGISPKLLHHPKPMIVKPITDLVNLSLSTSTFPDSLKTTQVASIYKKNSVLEKGIHRPVSVLPSISKIFDTAIETHLSDNFKTLFNPFLAAFRAGYGCQSTLVCVMEEGTGQ